MRAARVEVVTEADAINDAFWELSALTQHEVNSFVPGRVQSTEHIKRAEALNADMYQRGIRSRTIYLSNVRNHKATLDHVRWLNQQGSQVRTAANLPIRMIIADSNVAVLPLDPTGKQPGIVIYREPGVVHGLQILFDIIWASASPLGLIIPDGGESLEFDERMLLEMLALGRIDREIGNSIGKSERTVARKIADLMLRLNSKTRFEAGYQAVKKGWL